MAKDSSCPGTPPLASMESWGRKKKKRKRKVRVRPVWDWEEGEDWSVNGSAASGGRTDGAS